MSVNTAFWPGLSAYCWSLPRLCGPWEHGPPPCLQFFEAMRDECWGYLGPARLPVPCASLSVQEDGDCVFLGLAAVNGSATSMEGKLRHSVTVSSPGEPG